MNVIRYHTRMTEHEATSEVEPGICHLNDSLLPDAQDLPPLSSGNDAPVRPLVCIVHASVGSGHRSAAIALAEAFEVLKTAPPTDQDQACTFPDDYDIEVLDILDFGRIIFDGNKTASMFTGATRPFYDFTWRYTFTGRTLWGGGTVWSRVMFPKFTQYIADRKPIAIVCTHITAANVAVGARMITGHSCPIVCVPTDYEIEGFWPHRFADLFCVATEAMAETLRPRKLPESNIAVTGMPTRDSFRKEYDKEETRNKLGLPQDKVLALVLAGASLPMPYIHMREILDKALPYLQQFENFHFVFISGSDEEYYEHLTRSCTDLGLSNTSVLSYVEEMAPLMAASDLAICKSGGLTVTECLCAQTPMILLGKTYGQEKSNRAMLTATGAALHVTTTRELIQALRHISKAKNSLKAMLVNGEILRRPDAALDIAQKTLMLANKKHETKGSIHRKRFIWLYRGGKPAHTR